VANATENSSLGLVGGLALLWGMFKIFRTLDQAFSDIYESEHLNSMADQIGDAVFVFGAMGVAIALASTLDQLIPSLGSATMDAAVATLVSIFGLTLAFFPMFYVFPDEDVSVREVLPGTLLAATGWELLEAGFQHYVAIAGKSDTYGVLGAILLLITWLYLIGLVLLIGAALNAVISGRSEDVPTVDWGHVWRTGERRTADPDRNTSSTEAGEFTGPLTDLHAALDANEDADEITVQVGDDTVTLPRPDDPTVSTNTIQRPQFLGGQKVNGNLVFHWEADEAEDGDAAFSPSPKQFIARRRSEGDD
jgi:membrane protein